jgi:hypothetical protein
LTAGEEVLRDAGSKAPEHGNGRPKRRHGDGNWTLPWGSFDGTDCQFEENRSATPKEHPSDAFVGVRKARVPEQCGPINAP